MYHGRINNTGFLSFLPPFREFNQTINTALLPKMQCVCFLVFFFSFCRWDTVLLCKAARQSHTHIRSKKKKDTYFFYLPHYAGSNLFFYFLLLCIYSCFYPGWDITSQSRVCDSRTAQARVPNSSPRALDSVGTRTSCTFSSALDASFCPG